jgi:hypothetical protein
VGLLPEGYWDDLARILHCTANLVHLHIHGGDTLATWNLKGTFFQLQTFHSNLDWTHDLVVFLNTQYALIDLSVIDYNDLTATHTTVADLTAFCFVCFYSSLGTCGIRAANSSCVTFSNT